jgi:hypothetical protein
VRPKSLYSILASVPASEVTRESWDDSGDISKMLRSFDDGMFGRQPIIDRIAGAAAASRVADPDASRGNVVLHFHGGGSVHVFSIFPFLPEQGGMKTRSVRGIPAL